MPQPFVAVLMGSDFDLPEVEPTLDALTKLKIPYEVKVTSAHRSPDMTQSYVREADKRNCSVFICVAGMAAHLAGTVASYTTKPVVGIPVTGAMNGLDSLLSTVQMPAGVPVATVSVGKAGAKNAAYLAAQMMALADGELAQRLKEERVANAKAMQEKDAALQARLAQKD
ncbi:5-(carboxyamino)imidazole ribonucleotide mutase [Ketobacter sp.]|uniref:5-(carboxyamino)imidazole ribonucleotide mutase n=1 Tax=Ketobacter sp. TaxID=2083498 RepID=UPI000F107DA4|nr:5-(carboxyamino)imidazole ribonucleotide mutase [Ketobacter sp.]RLT99254.1 MAG: 5-(carboxyamino)imidazole ribonucleotide mutase [Ketobacter sp.]